jgi:predicted DNA-binding ribbon-helix-helix protein
MLRTTVRDVKQFYDQLKSLDPNGENGAISRNALLDTVDSSGIDLGALESLLKRTSEKVEGPKGLLAFFLPPRLEY